MAFAALNGLSTYRTSASRAPPVPAFADTITTRVTCDTGDSKFRLISDA
jgi:hypothetical protein